jgi:energy-coupling factor transporter ATP-binding protein EcfA2
MSSTADPRGSIWRRWDPHIHTPGTVMADQFGPDAWDAYFDAIEAATPAIDALGVTDYASLDRYVDVLAAKENDGRLAGVALLFPNVELRLPLMTGEGHPLNVHLLISPEDADHVAQARSFLRKLHFEYQGEQYECSRESLIALGKKHDPLVLDDDKALEVGTNQFKVTPAAIADALDHSRWAQDNILFAVAGGSNDGSSGLRSQDGSMEATRVEIEAMSRAIFSSQPAQRAFWLGKGPATLEQIETKWNGRKACLHGSDAHTLAKVGRPDGNRYTWIKGDPTFESLRQACLEPDERVIVDEQPPSGPLAYRTIDSVKVENAPWLQTAEIPLNRGLVAIIGARGSGKTALADLIAAVTDAASPERTSGQSFLRRAQSLLKGTAVRLIWADGECNGVVLPTVDTEARPTVQYLSQQFVERLCSSEGITDELLQEVERVVFEAHEDEDRLGARSFQELLAISAAPGREKRARAEENSGVLAEQIERERELGAGLAALKEQKVALEAAIASDKKARNDLITKGGEDRTARLVAVNTELATRQAEVDARRRQAKSLEALAGVVKDYKERQLPAIRVRLQSDYSEASLTETQWEAFDVAFRSDPAKLIVDRQTEIGKELEALMGPHIPKPTVKAEEIAPFIAIEADLSGQTYRALRAESWRLSELIGLDSQKTNQLNNLNKKISTAESDLTKLGGQITLAKGAAGRVTTLLKDRRDNYFELFEGFDEEQAELTQLYAPLKEILDGEGGTLGKLRFVVRRVVDTAAWARRGEELLDLRTTGTFRGRGELLRVVQAELGSAWETGTAAQVAAAMSAFREKHDKHFREQAKASPTNAVEYRRWLADVSAWVNSTDHISIQYGVQYDGVDIEQLSPGTRGIVLLLLYLSLDKADDRPLIIDQPEENLDPKSIFDELVDRFRETRRRRQIIIVTHNANLVVNTDADQVIIASAGAHRARQLPKITYTLGGLENPVIREQVCEILEGGRRAFEERARRLRFKLV